MGAGTLLGSHFSAVGCRRCCGLDFMYTGWGGGVVDRSWGEGKLFVVR